MTQPPTPDAIRAAILAHRKAAMHLQSVLIANGRRGASESATDEINRAGEEMAKSERDLLAQIGALRPVVYRTTREIPSDDGHPHSWVWDGGGGMHCDTCTWTLHFIVPDAAARAGGEDDE